MTKHQLSCFLTYSVHAHEDMQQVPVAKYNDTDGILSC